MITRSRGELMDETEEQRNAQLEGKWEQARGRVREAWGALTDDDLDRAKGNWSQLVGTIRERTGDAVDSIEARLSDILDRLEEAGTPKETKE
jgi:uncharacterized protein YjbJ (UPF0337 family)